MQIKYLFKSALTILSSLSLINSQFTECDEIKSFLNDKRSVYVEKCKVDEKGSAVGL